ncbi:MAG: glutaredoxin family protein [Pseudomonadota bacterium]
MKVMTTPTLRRGAFLGLALLLCAGTASAQLFKWVDANGKTHFSDTPPPANGKLAVVKPGNASVSTANLPYALANPARNHPVTLYTASACAGCDAGRSHLRNRGIPFAEKTVATEADVARLKAAGSDGSLPYIAVGAAKMAGFEAAAWDTMLKNAQYPDSKMLPPSYRYPAAVAAAPVPEKPATGPDTEALRRAAAQQQATPAEAAPSPTAPPGFRF